MQKNVTAFADFRNSQCMLRWVLQIPTVKRVNNFGLNASSSLATRHNPNRFGFCSRCSFGWRFVIFWILFGSNCKLTRSRSSLRSLFNRRQAESNIKLALNIAEARRRKAKANLQFDYVFLLLARNSSSKLGSPLARSPDFAWRFNLPFYVYCHISVF